jgi:rhodanese-related sulfurtransferase
VTSAAQRLQELNPHCRVIPHADGITPANAVALFTGYDVIVDGTDNFATRYLNNDAAFFAQAPLGVWQHLQVRRSGQCLRPRAGRALLPLPFPRNRPRPPVCPAVVKPACSEPLCGIIGSMQALETIKVLTGIGEPLRGRLLTYDARTQHTRILALPRLPHCPLCGPAPTIRTLDPARYQAAPCAITPAMSPTEYPIEVSVLEAKRLHDSAPDQTLIVDVREPHELAVCRLAAALHIPMREIPARAGSLPRDRHLLVLCHAGGRSRRVTDYLRAQGFPAVTNIAGGIDAWAQEIDPTLPRY